MYARSAEQVYAKRLNLTLVMAGYGEGGLEKHVVELANGLSDIDSVSRVSVIADPMYGTRLAAEVNFVPFVFSGNRRNPIALFKLWRATRSTHPDLVHAHGNKAASMIGSLLPLLRTHSVATLHSRKKNVRMFRSFERVIAVSKVSTTNLDHPGVRLVHNGIAFPPSRGSKAPPDAWNDVPRGRRVIAVGRLVPVKGFDVLLRAWSGIDAHLLILGEGFERARLEELIARQGLSARVRLGGYKDDVLSYMREADIMVIASRYEGCPYVLVEALQHDLPVISTRVGVMPEILPPRALCEVDDPDSLAGAIQSALKDMEGFAGEFAPLFEHARTELTLENMAAKTLSVYQEIV